MKSLPLMVAPFVLMCSCDSKPTAAEYNLAKSRVEEIARHLGSDDYDLSEAKTAGLALQATDAIAKGESEVAAIIAEGKIPPKEAAEILRLHRERTSKELLAAKEERERILQQERLDRERKEAEDQLERQAREDRKKAGQAIIATRSATDDAEAGAEIARLDATEGLTAAEKQEAKSRINRKRIAKRLADAKELRKLEMEGGTSDGTPTK